MSAPRTSSPRRAVALAAAVASLALGAACAGAAVLRASARAVSHELPPAAAAPAIEPSALGARIARGRTLFTGSCAQCHGLDARGDEGPDLHRLQLSDRYLARVVRQGIRGEMPAFAGKHDADDIAALTAYLRSLD